MYELHTTDELAVLLATADTLPAALTAADYLAAQTRRQLAANAEGTSRFRFHVAILDTTTGHDVAWASGHVPASTGPRRSRNARPTPSLDPLVTDLP